MTWDQERQGCGPGSSVPTAARAAPVASLSLDLDNEWAYLKTHGDPGWESYPSYLSLVVPRILAILARRGLQVTVFVVGQDAALELNRDILASITSAGHEVGNHSLRHDPWLHLYSEAEIEEELSASEYYIEAATGRRPVGFRGPGFSLSRTTLETLVRRGYVYDASTLPSFLGPVARAYYFATGPFDAEQRERLGQLFGGWREGTRSLRPYLWRAGHASLVEIPVTTFPVLRVPFHLTYVMYLAGLSRALARAYFATALSACRMAGVEPSILLHPLDFLGGEEVPRLGFFPSMKLTAGQKRAVMEDCLDALQRRFAPVTVQEHATRAASRGTLPVVEFGAG